MKYRAASQSQHARRHLRQEAMKRSHRRCDLIRLAPDESAPIQSPQPIDEERFTDETTSASP